ELFRLDTNEIARWPSDDPVGAERLPQLGDVVLDRVQRGPGRFRAPELVHEPVGRDDLVRTSEQQSEQRALAPAAEGERAIAVDGLQGAKNPELHRSARSQWLLSRRAHVLTERSARPPQKEER